MTRAALLLIGAATGHLLGAAFEAALAEERKPLPPGFVYLKDIDPTIVQDIRYATPFNFTGAPVPGYDAPECVLRREVAVALKAAQDELRAQNLGLKVYDCYRPRRAVSAFVDWVKKPDSKGDESHYPHTNRADLVKQGYISAVSSHSYGTAVDLTLIALPREPSQAEPGKSYGSCVAPKAEREPDESLDMGTGFDCFDPQGRNPALIDPAEPEAKDDARDEDAAETNRTDGGRSSPQPGSAGLSNSAAPKLEISEEQRNWRLALFQVMTDHGFKGIRAEWWHYQLARIGRRLKPQDFVIPSRKTP
jgi:D-alanyl-D-alanine dipeptidase